MPQILPYIATAAVVAGTVGQYKASEKAAKVQQTQADLTARRSAVAAIREVQMKRAAVINEAASMGASGGSAVSGGISGLGSQLGSGLGFSSQYTNLSRDLARTSQQAELFGALAKVGGWGVSRYGLPGSTKDSNG